MHSILCIVGGDGGGGDDNGDGGDYDGGGGDDVRGELDANNNGQNPILS